MTSKILIFCQLNFRVPTVTTSGKMGKKTTKKSGRKTPTRARSTSPPVVPAEPGPSAAPVVSGVDAPATASATKVIWELTLNELRKECVKLGIIDVAEKAKKEICIAKLTEYLSKRSVSLSDFKFAADGATAYPPILLNPPATPMTSEASGDDSDDESSESTDESDEEEEAARRKRERKERKKDKRSEKENRHVHFSGDPPTSFPQKQSPNTLPIGWQVLNNQVSGQPVALLTPDGTVVPLGPSTP